LSGPAGPRAWASRLTLILNQVHGADRFPVRVPEVALEFSRMVFPDDPIIRVEGADLPGFDGALVRIPRKGWGILYNSGISSPGRQNYTLGHELGHHLLHRLAFPEGIQCSAEDVLGSPHAIRQIEREADLFAADLLMPFDDLRRQLPSGGVPDLDSLSDLARRYNVSLLALVLRWLAYTERRAVLVVSRDDFILWARSSEPAARTRAYFRTSAGPIEIPAASLAARRDMLLDNRTGVLHRPGVWFPEEVREMTVFSEQYDMVISLLLLGEAPDRRWDAAFNEDDPVAVPVDLRLR
jgi:hypothetical protein